MPVSSPPMLSIVVPIYDVGSYLAPCLDSILASTMQDFELVCVNDGSTDGSGQVAEEYAEKDDRIRVIHVANGGLGRARNIGLDAATGRYLAFVDSDDRIPDHAYEALCLTLERTGSDLSTGRVRRFTETRSHQSGLHRRAIQSGARGTHITRMPSLIYDTTAWNKVYRRSFWDAHNFRFPEGVLYEDMPVTIPAHVLAEKVDVVTAVVYEWRERGDGSMSITQRRAELKNLQDRVTALEFVSDFLAERGLDKLSTEHDLKVLTLDLPLYLGVLDIAGAEFQRYFAEHVSRYLAHTDPETVRKLEVWDRVAFELLRRDRLEEAVHVVQTRNTDRSEYEVRRRGLHSYAQLPYLRDPEVGLPDEVYDVSNSLPVQAAIESVAIDGQDLVLTGHAFVRKISMDSRASAVRWLEFRSKETAHRFRVPLRPVYRPDMTAEYGLPVTGYDRSGFHARISLKRFRQSPARGAIYDVQVKMIAASARRGVPLRFPGNASISGGAVHYSPGGAYLAAYSAAGVFRVATYDNPTVVERVVVDVEHDTVDCEVRVPAGLEESATMSWRPSAQDLADVRSDLRIEGDDRTLRAASFPLLAFHLLAHDEAQRTWRASIDTGRGDDETRRPVVVAVDFAPSEAMIPARELAVRAAGGARVALADRQRAARVLDIVWDDGDLVVTVDRSNDVGFAEDVTYSLQRYGREPLVAVMSERPAARAILRFPVYSPRADQSLPPGMWSLRRHHGSPSDGNPLPLEMAVSRSPVPENEIHDGQLRILLSTEPRHMRLRLRSGRQSDAGPRNQHLLRSRRYPAFRSEQLEDTVLFQAWSGKQYSCSPRAILEQMQRAGRDERQLWVRRDTSVQVPEGVPSVLLWSEEYYRALATARLVIANDAMPAYYEKRTGSRYLQTWHGTPLKKIGFDIENVHFGNPRYLDEFAVDVSRWDFLISPNAYSTEIFRRAFNYSGEILETGYPRNDVFYSPDADDRRREVRERLSLAADQRVILWAPTWRDDQRDAQGRYSLPLPFDLSVWDEILEPDDVLLFRGHQLLQDTVGGMLTGAQSVRNVTQYPDIQDLYLAADVLITDYSSVMFDFANTRRPMIFYAWDLDIYRDKLRGFYVDFEDEVPGPLVTDLAGLHDVITDLASATAATADRYDRFVTKYCGLEDGHAAERVVDRLFGP